MTYTVAIIISVLISALITFTFAEWIETRQSKKRIELMNSICEIFKESMLEYKELILDLAGDLDKMKAELDKFKKLQEEQQ